MKLSEFDRYCVKEHHLTAKQLHHQYGDDSLLFAHKRWMEQRKERDHPSWIGFWLVVAVLGALTLARNVWG